MEEHRDAASTPGPRRRRRTVGAGTEALPDAPPPPRRVTAARDLAFLAAASDLLAGSLDLEETLETVARLSLPHLGSWCIVDLCESERMRRLAIVHPDPDRQDLARALLSGWPPLRDDPVGAPAAIRTRRSEVVSPVTDEMLVRAARSAENLALLRALEIGSLMTIPLLHHDEVLGAITYVSPNHGDTFSTRDLVLAEDLARRCAVSIGNARELQRAVRERRAAGAARDAAEEANLAKMRFLSMMSHELRTPLNSIAGYADLLASGIRGPLNPAQLADVLRIQANQRHLLGLVESVLAFAKLDSGRIRFGLEDVLLRAVLLEVASIVWPLAEQKGIAASVVHPPDGREIVVYADAEKLRQILVNLLGNAIKFSPQGASVETSYRVVGAGVEIRVRDQGIGIAPENLERIFAPFVQVDEGPGGAPRGTGLGLAISRELAVGMGGALGVESVPGEGSTFVLTLARGRG